MKITVYYEDKRHPTVLDVPDEDCEIWVEADYQKRLAAVEDKSSVARRTPQEIMDEECNKPTFNSHQRETRRHVSLDALDVDDNYIPGAEDVVPDFSEDDYADLYDAIRKGTPQLITAEAVRRRISVLEQCYKLNNIPFPEGAIL